MVLAMSEGIHGIQVTKVFGREDREIDRYGAENARQADLQVRQAMTGRGFFAVIQAFFGIAPALLYLVAGLELHGGSGLSHVFEITDLAGQLGLTTGTVSHLKVSFVRVEAAPVSTESVPGLEDYAPPVDRPTSIKVGRVNLFYD